MLHQGSICSATEPAARFVAAILDDPRVRFRCESARSELRALYVRAGL